MLGAALSHMTARQIAEKGKDPVSHQDSCLSSDLGIAKETPIDLISRRLANEEGSQFSSEQIQEMF